VRDGAQPCAVQIMRRQRPTMGAATALADEAQEALDRAEKQTLVLTS